MTSTEAPAPWAVPPPPRPVRCSPAPTRQGHGLTLFVGHDFAGRLLEVVIVDNDPVEEPVVIHAVALREKFRRQL